ncbi:MAG: DUF2892 domain-containing protein [Gammaproteobacteria bacterium]|nr:DUF2892 domain-containing protein [Gammaproteobacteria bacterium]MBL7000158.1 DUF2892 domain-containing protein [Gammaproteobacteria bacterium]
MNDNVGSIHKLIRIVLSMAVLGTGFYYMPNVWDSLT